MVINNERQTTTQYYERNRRSGSNQYQLSIYLDYVSCYLTINKLNRYSVLINIQKNKLKKV